MFEGFTEQRITTSGAEIHALVGGDGPPLALLHGYPQTHVMWHRVAPRLAEAFTVVAPDLRGYGRSSKPPGGEGSANYAKRAMARDIVEVMAALGHDRFLLAGHDRGGRVAYRLALDHPDRVQRLATLDIMPTLEQFERMDRRGALGSLPLVPARTAVAAARTPDRRRPRVVPARPPVALERRREPLRAGGHGRLRAQLPRPRDRARHLRRLPRRRHDRLRSGRRRSGRRASHRLSHAGALGRSRQRPPRRHDGRSGSAGRPISGAPPSPAATSCPRRPPTRPPPRCWTSSAPADVPARAAQTTGDDPPSMFTDVPVR